MPPRLRYPGRSHAACSGHGMQTNVFAANRTIVPTLRYRDVPAAIEWLCNAFGFRTHLTVPDEQGGIRFAQLTFGDGMVMLAPIEEDVSDALMVQPGDMGGCETQICYLFVEDAVAHCARAKAAGAEIVLDLADESSNGRGYSCRDPEGHIWNFGTYDPWQRQLAPPQLPVVYDDTEETSGRRTIWRLALIAATLAAFLLVAWIYRGGEDIRSITYVGPPRPADAQLPNAEPVAHEQAADAGMREMRELLARERRAKADAEITTREARAALAAAEREAQEARAILGGADRVAAEAGQLALAERNARQAAERSLEEMRAQLDTERSAREAAEQSLKAAREQEAKAKTMRRLRGWRVETRWVW